MPVIHLILITLASHWHPSSYSSLLLSGAKAKWSSSIATNGPHRLNLSTDGRWRTDDQLKVSDSSTLHTRVVYISCSYFAANLHSILTKHCVGGKSQSWLINTTAKPAREVVIEMRWPVYDPWAFKWGHHLKIHWPQWACNMFAMCIKASDLYFNYRSASILRMSHEKKKQKNRPACFVSQHKVPQGAMFYLSFAT